MPPVGDTCISTLPSPLAAETVASPAAGEVGAEVDGRSHFSSGGDDLTLLSPWPMSADGRCNPKLPKMLVFLPVRSPDPRLLPPPARKFLNLRTGEEHADIGGVTGDSMTSGSSTKRGVPDRRLLVLDSFGERREFWSGSPGSLVSVDIRVNADPELSVLVDASTATATATAKHAPQAAWNARAVAHAVGSAMGRRRMGGDVAPAGRVGVATPVADSGLLGAAIGDGDGERSTCFGMGRLSSRAPGCDCS